MAPNPDYAAAFSFLAGAMRELRADGWKPPALLGPDGRALTASAEHAYSRRAASTKGDLSTWRPKKLYDHEAEGREREAIAARAIDLAQSDPHAAGVVDTYATTVIGGGLVPMPSVDREALGMDRAAARRLQAQQRSVWREWAPWADAAGGIAGIAGNQFAWMRSMIVFGESFTLLPMLGAPERPYMLACQEVHPLRVKTPVDADAARVKDGIEVDDHGAPAALWIKKPSAAATTPDTMKNFWRVTLRAGHRWRVLHDFIPEQPGAVRGVSKFAPAMKYFRRFDQYLDAELAANVVTAAIALWIEVQRGGNPWDAARPNVWRTDDHTDGNADAKQRHYEYWEPGQILYGNEGEKPNTIAADRPGTSFDPFTRRVLKAMAVCVGLPYPVAFKDVDGVSFAGFRSAMLEAWRTFMLYRNRTANGKLTRIYTMLQEEAFLRGRLDTGGYDFYRHMGSLCAADWVGPPKGDIEPFKAAMADAKEIEATLTSRQRAAAERGRNWWAVIDDLEEEAEAMAASKAPADGQPGAGEDPEEKNTDEE